MMTMEPLFDYHVDLAQPADVGPGPFGRRQIFDVVGGTFHGPALEGTLLRSGGDWSLRGSDGVTRLDVRATLQTNDGALIYVQYPGVLVLDAQSAATLAAGGTLEWGEIHFVTQPRFETSDASYAWLNSTVAVAEGRLGPGWVEYRVYRAVLSPPGAARPV